VTVQTFYDKLIAVDAKIKKIRRQFLGSKRLRYAFGHKELDSLIRDLDEWCKQLDHDHLRRNITFEQETKVRAHAGKARDAARKFLHRPQSQSITTGPAHRSMQSLLPAPEKRRLTAGPEHQSVQNLLPAPSNQFQNAGPYLTCQECGDTFNDRSALFEHLEARRHAVDLNSGKRVAYTRPASSRAMDGGG